MKQLTSIWRDFEKTLDYPSLQKNITTEVAIIGGGITGITAAKVLGEAGISSVVLESKTVGSGTTGQSTGNLYYTLDSHLFRLESKYDSDTVKAVAASRAETLQQIRRWIEDHSLDCDYQKVPWYLYSSNRRNTDTIRKELQTADRAKLSVTKAERSDIPFPLTDAITIDAQAQINPLRYVQELATTADPDFCQIFEQTHVSSVERTKGSFELQTSGGKVTADKVIYATHTPKGLKFVQTLLGPYREYGIACRAENISHPEGIFWGLYDEGTVISTRMYNRDDKTFLIVIGHPHKVGQKEENQQVIESLADFAQNYFDVREIAYRWGGQHYRPADLLPFIGPISKGANEYIATGYSTDGLVYGTLSAMIIGDHITGKDNKWADFYDATRKQPLKSGPKFLKENIDVATRYAEYFTTPKELDLQKLKAGEGKVVKKEGQRLGVYRNEDEELEIVSAICTHMGCHVHWNKAEQTWDCPCHGSRFNTDGTVIEGPAFKPLQKNPVNI